MNLMEKYRAKLQKEPQGDDNYNSGGEICSVRHDLQLNMQNLKKGVGKDVAVGKIKLTQRWSNPYPMGTKEARNESIRQIEAARKTRSLEVE